jgi:hypothetical protein
MPIHPHVHRCQHIKVDGLRCVSPALTGEPHCYWHRNIHRRAAKLEVPALEDANAIQLAIDRIFRSMAEGTTDTRTGCSLLYALQLARDNMRFMTAGVPRRLYGKEAEEERADQEWAEYLAKSQPQDVIQAYKILMGFHRDEPAEAALDTPDSSSPTASECAPEKFGPGTAA